MKKRRNKNYNQNNVGLSADVRTGLIGAGAATVAVAVYETGRYLWSGRKKNKENQGGQGLVDNNS